ncbi:MAG: hypothetical protein IPM64_03745 [Phycisphaerales bacterium]|nr:hypothetical protein [Phycisphaerales bacterium]
MRQHRRIRPVAAGALLCAVAAVSISSHGCLLPEGGGFDADLFRGSYVGTWSSQTTGEGGPARIDIRIDLAKQTATLTLDFDGQYLGIDNPPAHEMNASFDLTGAKARGTDALFGDYNVVIAADGTMVGVFRNLDGGNVPLLTYTGKLTGNRISTEYDVVFADGRVVKATAELIKQ